MIRCPLTKEPLPTGIEATDESFATLLLGVMKVLCPHCRNVHEWTKTMAYIEPKGSER